MIFNEELLFLHVPKTAGMSLTKILTEGLTGEVYITIPEGHAIGGSNAIPIKGIRHETLKKANNYFKNRQKSLNDFKSMVAVIRNPYQMEISRFFYLRKGNPMDKNDAQKLAIEGNFEKFVFNSKWWFEDISEYYTLDGKVPSNMNILRFENLHEDFSLHCSQFLKTAPSFPVINKSNKSSIEIIITSEIEDSIYNKYKWVFDNGYYDRMLVT